MKFNRRQTILGLSGGALLPSACAVAPAFGDRYATDTFRHGVASGDPGQDSVVLWTRVSGFDGPLAVDWVLASDPDLSRIVATGTAETSAARDHTVKVVPGNLAAGGTWYFRFSVQGRHSPIGRTRTLPDGSPDQLVVAAVSCSNFPFGYFNGYESVADDPAVDLVVHLGDYIYEYDEDGYGGPAGKRLGRIHEPRHEIVSLSDYRTRHAQYKAEPGSLAMHAMHPLIHTWDDHESTNNPWSGGAQNHQPEEGDWPTRRATSLKAYYEWMPVREPAPGRLPEQRWAHFRYGDLASLITMESRHTARSEQIDLAAIRERLTDRETAQAVFDEVVGAAHRRMLSPRMERFIARELRESVASGRPWRVLCNQTIMANVRMPNVDDPLFREHADKLPEDFQPLLDNLTAIGRLSLPGNMDAWDGYPAARERFYQLAADAGARDLLVLTGDTHVFWQNQLFARGGERMGLELGTSAISSPRGFYQLGDAAMTRFDELSAAANESVVWVDGRRRGYIRLTLNRSSARADFISVSTVESPDYALEDLRSVRIRRQDGSLVYA